MCVRFALIHSWDEVRQFYKIDIQPMNLRPRYNIAPSQPILSITSSNDGLNENYTAGYFRWGLIPGWAKDDSIGTRLINARAETVHEKSSFRDAYRKRRCLIPISGFYEWNEAKQPFWITSTNSGFLSLAGIWESWISSSGEQVKTCAILTTKANKDLSEIHSRMPVILSDSDIKNWLTGSYVGTKLSILNDIVLAPTGEAITKWQISKKVNSVSNDNDTLIRSVNDMVSDPVTAEKEDSAQGNLFKYSNVDKS